VAVSRPSGEQVSVNQSTEIVGRVDRVSGDTLYMRVQSVRQPRELAVGVPLNGMVAIVRDRDTVVEQHRYSQDRTVGLILGGAALLFAIFLATRSANDVTSY
jgi:hypothetical protein